MTVRLLLLSLLIHFQINAQLGFDRYAMHYGEEHLENLVLHLIQNNASDFVLKVKRYEKGKLHDKYTCNYSIKDSILYQSCGKDQNEHEILENYLNWYFDPEADDLIPNHVFLVKEDSTNMTIRTIYRIRESDTVFVRVTKSYLDDQNRIKTQEITYQPSNIQLKNDFEYFQNDSIVETNYELINREWVPIRKLHSKWTPHTKVLTEYKANQADPVSKTSLIFNGTQISKLIIDYNDQKKRTMLFNSQYVIQVKKVKFRTLKKM